MRVCWVACIPLILALSRLGIERAIASEDMSPSSLPQPGAMEANRPSVVIPYYQDYQAAPPAPDEVSRTTSTLPNAINDPSSSIPNTAPPLDFPRPVMPLAPGETSPEADVPLRSAPLTTSPDPNLGDLAVATLRVQVTGAEPDLQHVVLQTIQTRPGGPTSQRQLQRDVAAILNTGLFTNATVASFARTDGVEVQFTVEPIVLRSLQLSGARVLPPTVANQIFQSQLGRAINPITLRQGVEQVNQWYTQNGYTLARVLAIRPNREGVLTLDVVEGVVAQVRIQFVNEDGTGVDETGQPVEGRTQMAFIRRELQTQPGQIFNEQTVRRDLQRLYDLELFDQADVALSGEAQAVTVTYSLQERLPRSFNLGGGYNEDAGIFGTIRYQDNNIAGLGQQLEANVQVGSRDLQFSTGFTSPYRSSTPNRLGYDINAFRRRSLSSTFSDEVQLPGGDDAREVRLGGGVSVMRPLQAWDARLGFNYANISIRDQEGDRFREDEDGNPLTLSGNESDDLFTLFFEVTRDQRDNPTAPASGSVLTLRTDQSIPIGAGTIFMNRLRANYVRYVPVTLLDTATATEPEVLAFNLQGGTILGDAPPYESFDLGGSNSVRGYGEGRVGTGRSYVQASAEYRFPLFRPVTGVLFADFASDLGSAAAVFGEPAVVRDKPGTGFGYGLGVRVRTPLGLIRADYGFSDEGDSRLHIGIGQRF